jgi:hypothetical protein
MKKILCCSALLILAGCGSGGGEGDQSAAEVAEEMAKLNLRPGHWQMITEVLSANAPSLPPETVRQMIGSKTEVENCMTPEDAKNPGGKFLLGQKNMDCTYRGFSVSGGVMTGSMSCAMPGMPGNMATTIEGKYSPLAYDIEMNMKAGAGGAKMDVKTRVSGRRTRDCA